MTATLADVPLLITSANSSSERRINPSWTIAHLKDRLEPITGVPAASQRLSLKVASQSVKAIEAVDETSAQLVSWPLQAYAEIHVGLATFSSTFLVSCGVQTPLGLRLALSRLDDLVVSTLMRLSSMLIATMVLVTLRRWQSCENVDSLCTPHGFQINLCKYYSLRGVKFAPHGV